MKKGLTPRSDWGLFMESVGNGKKIVKLGVGKKW